MGAIHIDAYAALGLPRDPSCSDARVREAFRQLSRRHHPDSGGEPEVYAQIASAYEILRTAGGRLRHWLETTFRADEWSLRGSVPDDLLDIFGSLSSVLPEAGTTLRKLGESRSALARSLAAPALLETKAALDRVSGEIGASLQPRLDALAAWDADARRRNGPEEGARLCRELIYLEKWRNEVEQLRQQVLGLL